MRKRGCAFLCSAVLLTGVFLRMPGEMWQVQAETIDTAAFAEETARLTNQFRQENGLAPLKMAPVLLELSARRAEELKDAYGHTRPDGRDWFTIVEESSLDANCYAAENVAAGYDTPESVIAAWIDSDAHRKAMLGENYQYIGIGVSQLEDDPNHYYTYWEMLLISSEQPLEGEYEPGETANPTVSEKGVFLLGDVDLDGTVELADAVLLQKILLGQVTGNAAQLENGDCCADGVLDCRDVTALMQMLDKRAALSGGAVDRELQPVLQGEARVTFHSPDLANLVHNPTPGTRMFSVSDGRQTQLSAVMLSEDDSAGQYQTRLTNALRRVGVQVHQQADGISFSTTEKQWPDIERTLSVRTDGDKSAFMPLKTFAEPSQAVRLAQSLQQGGAGISQTLESINQQRAQMAVQQEKARQLIDGMSRFPQTENAVQASENLGGVLDSANHNYQILLQAVNGQARISSQTVRNLLG